MYTFANRSHQPDLDPYFSNVRLLVTGSGNINDQSPLAISPTVGGSIVAASATGFPNSAATRFIVNENSYALYERTGGFLDDPNGDFTVEVFIQITDNPSCGPSGGYSFGRAAFLSMFTGSPISANDNGILNACCLSGTQRVGFARSGGVAMGWTQTNVNHVALSRESGVMRRWLNGVAWDDPNSPDSFSYTFDRVYLGNAYAILSGDQNVGGYIQARITTGVSRYNTAFTPPTSFPTSA